MGLFGKKKEEKSCCACAQETKAAETEPVSAIKVLGGGCEKCNALEASVLEALKELGMDTRIEHVRDFTRIAAWGVISTPALVVNGKVVSSGKVLKKDEAKALIERFRG